MNLIDVNSLKYKRMKEKLLSKLDNVLDNKLEYIFENEEYVSKLKHFELEGNTLELFYNLYFYPFNIDAWLHKTTNILIKQTIESILAPFKETKLTIIMDHYSLGFMKNIRDFIMVQIKNKKTIRIKSSSLNQTYVCTINTDSFQIINKYHKENAIFIDDEEIFIFSETLNKHILLQFILNPFWETKGFISSKITDDNVIINNNWEINNVDVPITIDGRFSDIENQIIENYFNPQLEEQLINLNDIQADIYKIISDKSIDYYIREIIFKTFQLAKSKILNASSIQVSTKILGINKRTALWDSAEPTFEIEEYLQEKRNLFKKHERIMIQESDVVNINPSDLGIILPILFDGKEKLLSIVNCFIQDTPYFPQNTTRREIIMSQFPGLKGNKYISNYGIQYLMKAENREINIKMHFIWDQQLWNFNHLIMNVSNLDLFTMIDNQTWLNYQQLLYLISLEISFESKWSTLLICRKLQKFHKHLPDYFESNIEYLLDESLKLKIEDYEMNKKFIMLESFFNSVEPSMFFANYLLGNLEFQNTAILKSLNTSGALHFLSLQSIAEQIKIVIKHLNTMMKKIVYNLHIDLENAYLEFPIVCENIWDVFLISGRLPLFNDINILVRIIDQSFYFNKKIYILDQKSEIKTCTIIIKRENYNLFFANLITKKIET